jgi:hypothetical protein
VATSAVAIGTQGIATQYLSGTQLLATIPASYLSSPGTLQIDVFNPPPGGGFSASSVAVTVTTPDAGSLQDATTDAPSDAGSAVTKSVSTGTAAALAITPDGTRVYLARPFAKDVLVLATADLSTIATIGVGAEADDVELVSSGTRALVALNASPAVTVIVDIVPASATFHQVLKSVTLGSNGSLAVGAPPSSSRYFALTQRPNQAYAIDGASFGVVGTLTPAPYTGSNSYFIRLAFSLDGSKGYGSLYQSDGPHNIAKFDTASLALLGYLDIGTTYPGDLVMVSTAAGPRLWVSTNGSGISVVDPSSDTVVKTLALPGSGDIAGTCASADGTRMFVMPYGANEIRLYDTTTYNQVFAFSGIPTNAARCALSPTSAHGCDLFVAAWSNDTLYKLDACATGVGCVADADCRFGHCAGGTCQ